MNLTKIKIFNIFSSVFLLAFFAFLGFQIQNLNNDLSEQESSFSSQNLEQNNLQSPAKISLNNLVENEVNAAEQCTASTIGLAIAQTAKLAIRQPGYETKAGYCSKFTRQVFEKVVWNHTPSDKNDSGGLFDGTARKSGLAIRSKGLSIPFAQAQPLQPGDIIFELTGSPCSYTVNGREIYDPNCGHVGIFGGDGFVYENSTRNGSKGDGRLKTPASVFLASRQEKIVFRVTPNTKLPGGTTISNKSVDSNQCQTAATETPPSGQDNTINPSLGGNSPPPGEPVPLFDNLDKLAEITDADFAALNIKPNPADSLPEGSICSEFKSISGADKMPKATDDEAKKAYLKQYEKQANELADQAQSCISCKTVLKKSYITSTTFYKLFNIGNFTPVVPVNCKAPQPISLMVFQILRVYTFIASLAIYLIILGLVIIAVKWTIAGANTNITNIKKQAFNLVIALLIILTISTLLMELLRAFGINENSLNLRG